MYTLVFQRHAALVNIVGDNDIRTHMVVAIQDGRPEDSGHAKTRTDICNGMTHAQWDHVPAPFGNVPIGTWCPHGTNTDGLLVEGKATTWIVLMDVGRTLLDPPEPAGARRGPSLVVKDGYKKAMVPMSVRHRVVRVGVVFVTVEVVHAAEMATLPVGLDRPTDKEIRAGCQWQHSRCI